MTHNSADIIPLIAQESILEEAPRKRFEKKIKSEWMPEIMEWAATGMSFQKMTDKIKDKWGVSMTPSGLRLAIKAVQTERSTVSKAVVRENVGTHISNDLNTLKLKKEELLQLSNQFRDSKDWKNYFQTIDKMRDYFKMSFELSGVNENQVISEQENAKQDLLDMFEKFHFARSEEK